MSFSRILDSSIKTFFILCCVVLAMISFPANLDNVLARAGNEKIILPKILSDIDGKSIDIERLAQKKKLFFVTLKATWCPVCFNQLVRLKKILRKLQVCGATFVVLSPGPRKALKSIQVKTEFPYPFVEDKDSNLAKKLNLVLAPNQIQPVIFAVNKRKMILR